MMIKPLISGKYRFKVQIFTMFSIYEITASYKNLITDNGVFFIIDTLINGDTNRIQNICLGNGNNAVSKTDTDLYNQTAILNTEVSSEDNKIYLTSEITGETLNGTTEIGVKTSNGLLVSRDVHEEIQVPVSANVTVNYEYDFKFGEYITGWIKSLNLRNIYQKSFNEIIDSIIEDDTDSGYVKRNNLNELITYPGSYLHDLNESVLYIHCTDSNNPNLHEILINTKGDE